MKKCPHCGGKNLEVEESSSHDFQIVYCLDCDAAFEMDRKGNRKSGVKSVDSDPEDERWQGDDLADEEELEEEDIDFDEER